MSVESIGRDISDVQASISAMGLSPELYVPDIGFGEDEVLAYAEPFPPQLLAGLQIFARLFCGDAKKAWAHLAAEMQAGKTGVVCVVLRLLLRNIKTLCIRPESVFILTGMSDNAWTKQTRERVPEKFRTNVQHSGSLSRIKEKLILMAKGEHLKNCLVVLDESHFASTYDNRPSKEVFDSMLRLCPIELWAENNVRVITISATDPALTLAMEHKRHIARDFRLLTTPAYQSVASLHSEGRLIESFQIKDESVLRQFLNTLDTKFGTEPLYHIMRPHIKKNALVQETLRRIRPDCDVITWDSSSSSKRSSASDGSSTSDIVDINEILINRPTKPTFIIIKGMFYASKTLCDTHVGALYDRCGVKDDTNLQSLLGRTCGYGKSKRTIVFTSVSETVTNYLRYWRDITSTDTIVGDDAEALSGRMAGVCAASGGAGGNSSPVLKVAASRAIPIVAKASAPAPAPTAVRVKADDNDWISVWSSWFPTEEEAMVWWGAKGGDPARKGGKPRRLTANAEGFLECTTTAKAVQTLAAVELLRSGKKTTNMPVRYDDPVGKEHYRRYAAYGNTNDQTTARFCVHWIRKIK